jgi:serine/threonine protein phosphatase PrpC
MCYFLFSAMPDVTVHEIQPEHEFMVLACDGIWDVLSNQEVVDFVRVRIAQNMEPDIVSISTASCVYVLGCTLASSVA